MCSVSDIALRKEPRFSCRGSLVVAMVSARCWKRADSFGRWRKAVSQQTETRQSPVHGAAGACGASYPLGIAPWSAKERCTPGSAWTGPIPRQVIGAWRAAVRRRSCQWNYPLGIVPWSAKERCAPGSSADKADPAAGDRGLACSGSTCSRQWNYPLGIALLEATGIHFTALQARSLAGEQVAQPLDVLPGDFWRHRLALRLGWWRCCW